MKDYEKIHKWKIYSFSERVFGWAVWNRNQNLLGGGLLLCKIFHKWKFSTNDYDDWWNWIGIYIREIIHECKFFLLTFVKFFTVENFFICDFFHKWKWERLSVTNVTDFYYQKLWIFSQSHMNIWAYIQMMNFIWEPFSLEKDTKRTHKGRYQIV